MDLQPSSNGTNASFCDLESIDQSMLLAAPSQYASWKFISFINQMTFSFKEIKMAIKLYQTKCRGDLNASEMSQKNDWRVPIAGHK